MRMSARLPGTFDALRWPPCQVCTWGRSAVCQYAMASLVCCCLTNLPNIQHVSTLFAFWLLLQHQYQLEE